jgi:hypothetical protein
MNALLADGLPWGSERFRQREGAFSFSGAVVFFSAPGA